MDTDYTKNQSTQSSRYNTITRIIKLIFDEIEMSEKFLTKMKKDCFGMNLQALILCDIIQDWLLLNYLQKVVVKKVLN